MMKKSKTDFEFATTLLASTHAEAGGLQGDLSRIMRAALSESNARGLRYMISYYGLGGEPGLTLEAIGEGIAGGLTRERVRQIIDGALSQLKRLESAAAQRPYATTLEKFNAMIAAKQAQFLRLSEFTADDYFSTFKGNAKGLIAFLNDTGIRQVVYRGAHYIYPASMDRKNAICNIQAENKKSRRAKTVEKMECMAKTVTYVPKATRESLLGYARANDMALNRLYEKILADFMEEKPCRESMDFAKTQSWRARQGKAEWSQVGIYISKNVFEQVRGQAASLKPEPVSNMSYICQAFVWFAQRQPMGEPASLDAR